MKKIISLVLAMVMVLAMGVSAFAAPFVGSVLLKHRVISARIIDENGNTIDDLKPGDDCLVVTHISNTDDAPQSISNEIDFLIKVYDDLKTGDMEIPYENYGYDADTAVLVDLYDATFTCNEHPVEISPIGTRVELVLEASVGEKDNISVMTYKNGEWKPIVSAVNNGNGTITCVFEDFCPIAISVVSGTGAVAGTESNPNTGAPVFGVVAVVAAAACAVFARKK